MAYTSPSEGENGAIFSVTKRFLVCFYINDNKKAEIQILGVNFVQRNFNKMIFIINNKKHRLASKYKIKSSDVSCKIKFLIINNISNLDSMYEGCCDLIKIKINEVLDFSQVNSMEKMFYGCMYLEDCSDLSKLKVKNLDIIIKEKVTFTKFFFMKGNKIII